MKMAAGGSEGMRVGIGQKRNGNEEHLVQQAVAEDQSIHDATKRYSEAKGIISFENAFSSDGEKLIST
ncbi:hypothetical protein [Undibacterium luofuense]|uniref:hypothetical protein n=1 Tax=Undibacterium luofuense TaxID=2828733 RepID=UPI0030ED2258